MFAYLKIILHLYTMIICRKDIIDRFKILRDLKTPVIYGPFEQKEMLYDRGGQFMDINMQDGRAVTISLN